MESINNVNLNSNTGGFMSFKEDDWLSFRSHDYLKWLDLRVFGGLFTPEMWSCLGPGCNETDAQNVFLNK